MLVVGYLSPFEREINKTIVTLVKINGYQVAKNVALLFFTHNPEDFFPGAKIENCNKYQILPLHFSGSTLLVELSLGHKLIGISKKAIRTTLQRFSVGTDFMADFKAGLGTESSLLSKTLPLFNTPLNSPSTPTTITNFTLLTDQNCVDDFSDSI